MKFDSRYSAQIRPIYRVLAGLICLPMLLFGFMAISELFTCEKGEIKEIIKFALPQIFFGLFLLTASLKGSLPKSLDQNTDSNLENNRETPITDTTRKQSLKMLVSIVGVIIIIFSMFYMFDRFTIFWWLTVIMAAFWIYMYYLSSTLLLVRFHFHHRLSLTIVFPIIVLLIGIFSPKTLEQRETY